MLCPEVWNFQAPKSSISYKIGNSEDINFEADNFFFSHLVSVILPDTLVVSESLSDKLIVDCDYYKISNIPISELVNKKFLNNFLKEGNLTALSINTRSDCDNCVCVTPTGILGLLLNKEDYQTIGIDGEVSKFNSNTKSRYLVKVDLKELSHKKPAKFETISQKLGKYTLLVSWEPNEEGICPSSIAKYFHDLEYDVQLCSPKFNARTKYSVKVPKFGSDDFDPEDISNFVEWLGMFTVDGDTETGSPDNYITTYETSGEHVVYGQVKHLLYRGFYTSNQIQELFHLLSNYFKLQEIPWIALYVQGFSDSPFGCGLKENNYSERGNNSFTFVMNKSRSALVLQECSYKKNK